MSAVQHSLCAHEQHLLHHAVPDFKEKAGPPQWRIEVVTFVSLHASSGEVFHLHLMV